MSISINDISLNELLPQKPPFIMIDRLVSSDDTYSVAELEIREDNVFFINGCLTAAGLVENIAQTCAAGIGYRFLDKGLAVKVGVIGAVNNLNVLRLPRKGETITTTVKFMEKVFQMTLFDAVIKCGEEELARGTIKTALSDNTANN